MDEMIFKSDRDSSFLGGKLYGFLVVKSSSIMEGQWFFFGANCPHE